ncbi:MAG: T9SS type A sorting domain-containing protein [Bacteroidetes bacterium]|nr:T9SS type A sorting domain-containing protein [Bacteroidota bacterium]
MIKKILFKLSLVITLLAFTERAFSQDRALNFDGFDDYVNVPSIPSPTGSFTAEAWARMETKGQRTVLSKIGTGYYGYTISYDFIDDRMEADMGTGTNWVFVASILPWNLNQWYHVAFVYDATISTLHFYQDGALQGSVVAVPSHSFTSFKIGNDDWNEVWDGDIDEVRYWNIARTQSEIQSTMHTELTGTETGLVNYYKFNQGVAGGNNTTISTLTDSKGTSTGSILNFDMDGPSSNFVGSNALGIDIVQDENFSIYPNPVQDELIIVSKTFTENLSFEIYNSLGQLIVSNKLTEITFVNTQDYKPGLYFFKLRSGQNFWFHKFVKNEY